MTDKPKLKQTEVGMIPSDWEVKTLGELVDMSSGTTPSRFNEKNFQGNVCWLSSGELKSHYIYNTKEKISEAAASTMRLYPKGTVVIAMYGLEAEGVRGTSSILAKECTISQACMAFTNLRKINNEFFYYWYAANGDEIGTRYAQGTKQQNLSPEVMKNVVIPLPPTIKEQQRIANALSDVDTLIANLEKLIAKKKNIKQGAMQQLLTGKKRLPGFAPDERTGSRPTDERRKECHSERSAKREVEKSSGYKMTELGLIPSDWEFVPVSELAKDMADGPFGSNLKKEHYTSDPQTRIIQLSNIGENGWEDENTKYTTFEHAKTIARCIVPKEESILVAKMMPAGRAIICPKKEKQYVLGSDVIRITANEKLNSKYFVYASKSDAYLKQISDNTQGSTRQRTSISKLRKILILLPSLAEQTAIANVLSDMDTEISALETKLAKYRTLKTGMMQQLLTGKIRLV